MKKKLNWLSSILKRNEIVRNTSILISGTVLAQIIPILLQPILRRLYSTETFGAYSIYISLVGIFYVISGFRYEQTIILPKESSESQNLFFISQFFNVLISFLLFIIIIVFINPILRFINLPTKFSIFIYFVPLGVFFFNLFVSINFWLIRTKSFFAISKIKVIRRGTEGLSQISFSILKNSLGIVWGDIIGHIANVSYGMHQSFKTGLSIRNLKWKNIVSLLKKYSDYPKYNLLTSFMSAFSFLMPAIIINKYYGIEYTGYFDLTKMVLSVPIALVAGSIASVMIQKVAERKHKNESISKEIKLIIIVGLIIGLIEATIILPFGPMLFSFIFGSKWEISGQLSRLLLWPFILDFFTISLSGIFLGLGKIKQLSIYQFIYFLLIVSLFLFTNVAFQSFIRIYVIIVFFSSTICLLILYLIYKKYSKSIKQTDSTLAQTKL